MDSHTLTPRWRAAATLLLAAGLATPSFAGAVSWIGGAGGWYDASNWTPFGVPGGADDVFIGNHPAGEGGIVGLGGNVFQFYNSLEVSTGSTLDTNGTELISTGEAWIVGENSRIIARPNFGGPHQWDFQGELHIGQGARLELRNDVPVRFVGGSVNAGMIMGNGSVLVESATPLNNSGSLRPDAGEILIVQQGAAADQAIDLDGNTGNGHLQLDQQGSFLQIIAQNLNDQFSGQVTMVPGAELFMSVTDGWTTDLFGSIDVHGVGAPASPSIIDGSELTFGGTMVLHPDAATLLVDSSVVLTPNAIVSVGAGSALEFQGGGEIEGGMFDVAPGANLYFDGVVVRGGDFTTGSQAPADGVVSFGANIDWAGSASFSGYARQNGPAQVIEGSVITADTFDMDGTGGGSWEISAGLIVNANLLDVSNNIFDGTMTINGGFFPKLIINLDDPEMEWCMDGVMSLHGITHLTETRLAGNPVVFTGTVNVTGGRPIVFADARFSNPGAQATVDIGASTSELVMAGDTYVREPTVFVGAGTLVNAGAGTMTLENGVDLATISLRNLGAFEIDHQEGAATVHAFEQGAGGIWTVTIGGYNPGVDHDQLIVFGNETNLDGALEVKVNSGFEPMIGDTFTILTSPSDVLGSFVEDPVSANKNGTYYWQVHYNLDSIVLELDDIGPAPTCCLGNATKDDAGVVNFADITSVLFHWLEVGDGSVEGDANCDGVVNFEDITSILQHWGNLCP